MTKAWIIGWIAVSGGLAQQPLQTPFPTPVEAQRQLQGRWEQWAITRDAVGQARPSGEPVSVAHLRHKVRRGARKRFERAARLLQEGQYEKAAAELQRAVQRDPRFADAYNDLGVAYRCLGRPRDAEAAFRRTLELDPELWRAHYNLAVVLFQERDFPGAEQSARRALRDSGENPWAHLLMGYLLYLNPKTRAEGLRHVEYAARTLPDAQAVIRTMEAP